MVFAWREKTLTRRGKKYADKPINDERGYWNDWKSGAPELDGTNPILRNMGGGYRPRGERKPFRHDTNWNAAEGSTNPHYVPRVSREDTVFLDGVSSRVI